MRKRVPQKRVPQRRVSAQEQGRRLKIILALVLVAVMWIVFSPGTGLLSLMMHRSELTQLQQKTAELEKENSELQAEINQLQSNPEYLEELARKEYGLLKKNERVFDFSKNSKAKEK